MHDVGDETEHEDREADELEGKRSVGLNEDTHYQSDGTDSRERPGRSRDEVPPSQLLFHAPCPRLLRPDTGTFPHRVVEE